MDGAQDVMLNLDDDEAEKKNSLRICYKCDELLEKYVDKWVLIFSMYQYSEAKTLGYFLAIKIPNVFIEIMKWKDRKGKKFH